MVVSYALTRADHALGSLPFSRVSVRTWYGILMLSDSSGIIQWTCAVMVQKEVVTP
jgi:hypothetical protein